MRSAEAELARSLLVRRPMLTTSRSLVSLGLLLAGVVLGCSAQSGAGDDDADEPIGEAAGALRKCDPELGCGPVVPDPPVCEPKCDGACGIADGCGGTCRTGTCSATLDHCGGGGVAGRCGHRNGDLRYWQTGFRKQEARDTCTVFATVAAVEAAYKRQYRRTLDLSEEYLHHFQKAQEVHGELLLPKSDTVAPMWGGGNIPWNLNALKRYGMPREIDMPYIPDAAWDDVDRWLSPTRASWEGSQRAFDDLVLSNTSRTYFIGGGPFGVPVPITTTMLPQAALDDARYTITGWTGVPASNRAAYKAQLDAGREVVIQFFTRENDPFDANGVRQPGPTQHPSRPSHAMLVVGYDDALQAFWVKNSWTSTTFELWSYAWVDAGHVSSAAVVDGVKDPDRPFGRVDNAQLTLGRWNLDLDGWHATLDVYRLPRSVSAPGTDTRVGTYFGPDGIARRVSGGIENGRFDFYVDPNVADQPIESPGRGLHFTTFVYDAEHTTMSGSVFDPAAQNTWSVSAKKDGWITGTPRANTTLSRASYWGRWELVTDGVKGTLAMTTNLVTGAITGTLTKANGAALSVNGQVTADPRIADFGITDAGVTTTYHGLLNGHALGIMTGSAARGTLAMGFHASRLGD